MALEVGILGLPNVGKSTLFRALTKVQVEAAEGEEADSEDSVKNEKTEEE